jgi:hypothetical protein
MLLWGLGAALIGWGAGSAARAIGLFELGHSVAPPYSYRGAKKPSPIEAALGRRRLAEAESELGQGRLDSAERLLGTCVEVSDLPDCHRVLASLLSITGRRGAHAHLERYVQTTTAAADLEAVRKKLAR